jgi:hypothetical protein
MKLTHHKAGVGGRQETRLKSRTVLKIETKIWVVAFASKSMEVNDRSSL